MDFIKWNEIYSVGISEIDDQHKKLIDIINKLFKGFSEGKADEIIPDIINELINYTEYHFKTEEDLFNKYNLPEKEKHIQSHKQFVEKIKTWKDNINEKELPYELMDYLKNWLVNHIMKEDKQYSSFFEGKDISE